MGIKDFFFGKPAEPAKVPEPTKPKPPEIRPDVLDAYYKDFQLAVGSKRSDNIEEAVKSQPRAALPAKTYQRGQTVQRDNRAALSYEGAQYDLPEIAKARDTESLINTSAERHVETALQSGWSFDGPDDKMVDYMEGRVFDLEVVSNGMTMYKILNMLLDQMVTYGTAFLIVRRDKSRSRGKQIKMFGKNLDPIASWAVADAPTMRLAENKSGHVIGWKQEIAETGTYITSYGGEHKTQLLDFDEVFVFTRHKQAGRVFGRSLFLTVLDDVILLRSLENLVQIISQKYAFPLFQYVVGTKERPAGDAVLADGTSISEVELAQAYVDNMPVEGTFVTPERHEIRLIGTEGKVLDLTDYLAHFRTRVQEGVRMSNTTLGTQGEGSGASKGQAQTQMKSMQDSSKYLQDCIVDGFRMFILQMLMEGDYDVDKDNMVELSFSPPDSEEERACENHVLAQYQGGTMSLTEARRAMGKRKMSKEDEDDTFLAKQFKREKDLARTSESIKAKAQVETAKHNVKAKEHEVKKEVAKEKTEHAKAGTLKEKAIVAKIQSKVRPQNQHGKKATKSRNKKNDFVSEILSLWDGTKNIAVEHAPVADEPTFGYGRVTSAKIDDMMETCKRYLAESIQEGTVMARNHTNNPLLFVTNDQAKQIYHSCRQAYKRLLTDCVGKGFQTADTAKIVASFSHFKDEVSTLSEKLPNYALRAAYIAALGSNGVKSVSVKEQESETSATISTSDFCNKALMYLGDLVMIEAE